MLFIQIRPQALNTQLNTLKGKLPEENSNYRENRGTTNLWKHPVKQ